jgi:hypothetical protein
MTSLCLDAKLTLEKHVEGLFVCEKSLVLTFLLPKEIKMKNKPSLIQVRSVN